MIKGVTALEPTRASSHSWNALLPDGVTFILSGRSRLTEGVSRSCRSPAGGSQPTARSARTRLRYTYRNPEGFVLYYPFDPG